MPIQITQPPEFILRDGQFVQRTVTERVLGSQNAILNKVFRERYAHLHQALTIHHPERPAEPWLANLFAGTDGQIAMALELPALPFKTHFQLVLPEGAGEFGDEAVTKAYNPVFSPTPYTVYEQFEATFAPDIPTWFILKLDKDRLFQTCALVCYISSKPEGRRWVSPYGIYPNIFETGKVCTGDEIHDIASEMSRKPPEEQSLPALLQVYLDCFWFTAPNTDLMGRSFWLFDMEGKPLYESLPMKRMKELLLNTREIVTPDNLFYQFLPFS